MAAQRILIIDDDARLLGALEVRCAQLGLEVVTTRDIVEGLAEANRHIPDLILLDVRMPGGSGLGACELITTSSRLRSVPVVVMTGLSDEGPKIRSELLGARFVRKGAGLWERLEPILRRDLGLEPAATRSA